MVGRNPIKPNCLSHYCKTERELDMTAPAIMLGERPPVMAYCCSAGRQQRHSSLLLCACCCPESFTRDAIDVTLGGSFPSTSCTWRLSIKGSRIWCRRWMTTTRFSMATSSSPPAPGAVLPKLSPNHSANWFLSSNTCRHVAPNAVSTMCVVSRQLQGLCRVYSAL